MTKWSVVPGLQPAQFICLDKPVSQPRTTLKAGLGLVQGNEFHFHFSGARFVWVRCVRPVKFSSPPFSLRGALAQPRVPSAAMAAATEVTGCIPRPIFSKAKTVREFHTVLPNKTINKEKLHTYKA